MSDERYRYHSVAVENSARRVLEFVFELIQPESIVDIGCGDGAWLSAAKSLGVGRVLGLDDSWVLNSGQLQIAADEFRASDLRHLTPLSERFDMAMCLEVAEHLPEDAAQNLITALTAAAPVVLFSAAIPGQGGRGHINENWPTYWLRFFERANYVVVDAVRPKFWDDSEVIWYYRQNILLYVAADHLTNYPRLAELHARTRTQQLCLVHPELLDITLTNSRIENQPLRQVLSRFPQLLSNVLKRRLGGS